MNPANPDDTTPESPESDAREQAFAAALALAQAGDPQGWSELYRRHNSALMAFLRSQMPAEAEDLASETWISATRTIHSFTGDERSFRSWLVTIGRRRFIDRVRAHQRHGVSTTIDTVEHQLEGGEDPSSVAVRNDQLRQAAGALHRLGGDEAEVIRLRVLAGLDTEQVAKLLGRTPNSVRVLQHRALKKLAVLMGDGNAEPTTTMDSTR